MPNLTTHPDIEQHTQIHNFISKVHSPDVGLYVMLHNMSDALSSVARNQETAPHPSPVNLDIQALKKESGILNNLCKIVTKLNIDRYPLKPKERYELGELRQHFLNAHSLLQDAQKHLATVQPRTEAIEELGKYVNEVEEQAARFVQMRSGEAKHSNTVIGDIQNVLLDFSQPARYENRHADKQYMAHLYKLDNWIEADRNRTKNLQLLGGCATLGLHALVVAGIALRGCDSSEPQKPGAQGNHPPAAKAPHEKILKRGPLQHGERSNENTDDIAR